MRLRKHMKTIQKLKGITYQGTVSKELQKEIARREEKRNTGVHACLRKKQVLVFTHTDAFREPLMPLLELQKDGSYIFPPQPFPEANNNAIVSCPSAEVHQLLADVLQLNISKDEATLLVGYD